MWKERAGEETSLGSDFFLCQLNSEELLPENTGGLLRGIAAYITHALVNNPNKSMGSLSGTWTEPFLGVLGPSLLMVNLYPQENLDNMCHLKQIIIKKKTGVTDFFCFD